MHTERKLLKLLVGAELLILLRLHLHSSLSPSNLEAAFYKLELQQVWPHGLMLIRIIPNKTSNIHFFNMLLQIVIMFLHFLHPLLMAWIEISYFLYSSVY